MSAWHRKGPAFRAALNRRRREMRAEWHDLSRALVLGAAEALAEELRGPNRLQAAVPWDQSIGALRRRTTRGAYAS